MDRVIKEVVAPPLHPLTRAKLFDKDGMPDLPVLKAHLQREGRLEMSAAMELVKRGEEIFKQEKNILYLKYPVTVCGDVHGQFFDLVRLLEVGGNYLQAVTNIAKFAYRRFSSFFLLLRMQLTILIHRGPKRYTVFISW